MLREYEIFEVANCAALHAKIRVVSMFAFKVEYLIEVSIEELLFSL